MEWQWESQPPWERGTLTSAGASERTEPVTTLDTAQVGLAGLLATVAMLFFGFTSAYLVRRAGGDWQTIALPPVLWVSTGLILASSITLELSRAALRRGEYRRSRVWLKSTVFLGLGFLAGQLAAWSRLTELGVYLPTSPHSSFFYMLTGMHGLHLAGGIVALAVAARRQRTGADTSRTLGLAGIYWHFVGVLWVYLFVLLYAV